MEDFLTEKGSAKERALVNVTDHVTEKISTGLSDDLCRRFLPSTGTPSGGCIKEKWGLL